jgi:hypothetical protein
MKNAKNASAKSLPLLSAIGVSDLTV